MLISDDISFAPQKSSDISRGHSPSTEYLGTMPLKKKMLPAVTRDHFLKGTPLPL